jgi:serine phosphatase RsbU (regulator of sigma subunit)
MLGLDRLQEQFQLLCGSSADCTAEDLAGNLNAWLDEFRGSAPIGDDRTLLIARRV